MQGLITLDFGNSHPHAGLFHRMQNQWVFKQVVPWDNIEEALKELDFSPDNTSIVLAQVHPREEELLKLLQQGYLLTRVQDYWRGQRFAGMPVNYGDSLGEDRLIEAFYCYKQDKTPTLIIDAGSFTTLDVVNDKGFQGGYIVPGIKNYLASFSQGAKLKSVVPDASLSENLPHQTAEALKGGYQAMGLLAKDLIHKESIKKIILTGGDAALWEKMLAEHSPMIHTHTHLIHHSLHYWMTTQIEPL